METFIVLIYLVVFIFGILQIILFFKVWGMTNNVNKILKIMQINSSTPTVIETKESHELQDSSSKTQKFNVGESVKDIGSGIILKIDNFEDGIYKCSRNGSFYGYKKENDLTAL